MNSLLEKCFKHVPLFRKYVKLDQEEKELRPKVEAGIKRVMANGDSTRKKRITGTIREKMKKQKMEVPA